MVITNLGERTETDFRLESLTVFAKGMTGDDFTRAQPRSGRDEMSCKMQYYIDFRPVGIVKEVCVCEGVHVQVPPAPPPPKKDQNQKTKKIRKRKRKTGTCLILMLQPEVLSEWGQPPVSENTCL